MRSAAHPRFVGGPLSAQTFETVYEEAAPVVADAVCRCARGHQIHAPGEVSASIASVPGQGRIESRGVTMLSAASGPGDWSGFDGCVAETLAGASVPVHVIGSDVVPDADPSDERIVVSISVALR